MSVLTSPRRRLAWLVLTGALAMLLGGHATAAEPLKLTNTSFLDLDDQAMSAKGRPNEAWRWQGLKSFQSREYAEAVRRFELAARHADKYSQHYLSLIHWHGAGVPVDHVQAYIWADLAAERGSRPLLAIREKMWSQLTTAEQAQVAARGTEFYDRYGDAVAQPRAEAEITRFARNMTGSRTGFQHNLVGLGKPVNGQFAAETGGNAAAYNVASNPSVEDLYSDRYKNLAGYWREQDALIGGTVEVGPMQPVRKPSGQ